MSYANAVTVGYFSGRNTNFAKQLSDYLNGESTYDEALKQAQKQLEIYLSE